MKKNLTMQLLPLWLLAFFFFASVPIKAQTYSEATPRIGIVKMIGCGTGTEANKAQIQVIHDGTGYSYNFGANASARSGNTAWVPVGTHTVTVTKGARTYKLPITVPAKVVPTFTPTVTYNCNGTADVRLTNNQGTYNYTYTYGGNTHNSPYFRDLAVGQHTITVKYTQPIAERDIVFFDDFGTKETGDPRAVRSKYAISTMNFAPLNGTQVKPDGTILTGVNLRNDACYTVATKADADTENVPTTWLYPNDKDGKANGRYLYYDAYTINQNLYTRKAKVKPNTPVNFSAYLFNTVKTTYNSGLGATYTVRVTLDIYANEAAAQAGTAPLFRSYYFNVPAATTDADKWYPINVTANISGSYSELVFVVRMYGDSLNGGIGNDIALDNVLVTQPTAICEQTLAVPVNVVSNTNTYSTTVTYNCAANNATIKVTPSVTTGYTYTYKLDNGTAGSNNTFNNVAVGVHTLTLTSQYTGAKVIFKEDFGSGAPYRLPETVVPKPFVCKDVLYGYPADILPEGHYQVANVNNLTQMNIWNWRSPKDHTNSADVQGRYLAFNHGANAHKPFYKQDIRVEVNKPVTVEYYAYNINKNSTVALPAIKVTLVNKATNSTVHTSSTYAVTGNTSDTDWRKVTFTFTPPVNARDLELNFINEENSEGSNDFAIDDILVTQAYEVCATTVTATVAPKVTRAFAGVTKLIGCGTGANANKAEVTIANMEGGTGAYQYNFDGTWTTTNVGWLPAGTHTVSVRAAGTGNSCQYDMSVTVPNPIAQPTIKTEVFYACNGKAILNIGVENPDPALKYLYSLDGAAYTSTYLYTNVASGTHSVSVQYEHRSTPSPMLLWREDFGTGDPTTNASVNSSDFTFRDPRTNSVGGYGDYTVAAYKDLASPNQFEVARGVTYPTNPAAVWRPVFKGTTTGANDDRYLYVDMANNTYDKVFMEKEVIIDPHNLIEFSYQIRSYDAPVIYLGSPIENPNMQIRIVEATNPSNVLGAINSGKIPHDGAWHLVSSKNMGTINPNGVTRIKIQFINKEPSSWGNDLAIDDITVWQTPKACGQVVSTTKVVTANNQDIPAFTVSKTYDCATGKGALTVTPTATTGFTYTYTLGSTTYTSTTATFTGLTLEQTYTVSVSYQAVSNTVTLLNEDFGTGTDAVKSPYTGGNLYYNKNINANYTAYNANGQSKAHSGSDLNEGEYTISHNLLVNIFSSVWRTPNDHTGNTNGRIFFVNPSPSTLQTIYAREVNVLPNQALTFSAYFYNLLITPGNNPKVQLTVYKNKTDYENNSTPLKNFISNEIPRNANNPNAWKQESVSLTATEVGARSSVYVVVSMVNPESGGHDMAMDDIKVTQVIAPCTTSVTATLTKGDVAAPTLTLPANLSVICSAPTASATISSWIASATATSTCGTATVTHNYNYPSNLCNVTGGAVTVTFSTTDPFGNVVSGTRVITFATMTLTVTPTALTVPNGITGGTTSSVVPNITLGGVASPSTNSVTITFSGLPTGVTSTTGGRLIVAPNTPAGSHTITYRVCETAGHNNCKTVTSTLVIGTGSLTVTPVTPLTVPNGISGGTTSSVLTGVRLNGNVVTNTNSVTISFSGLPAGVTTDTQGRIVIPAGTPATSTLVTYKVCDKLNPTNCQTVTSTLVIGTGSLTVTPVTPLTVPNGISGGTTSSVLTGVRLNGNVVTNTNSVTISFSGLPTGVTSNTNGQLVIPAGTPAGTHTITYKVCEKLNPTNCQTVTSTLVIGTGSLTVTLVTPLTVPNGISGGTTSSVLTGITLNGATVTNTNSITISFSGLPTGVTSNTNGQLVIPVGTPAGTHTITYRVCEKLNPTNCQTVTSTLVIGTGSLTVTPVTPLTVPNGISGGTTSSVLTGVRLNGNVVTNTNSVTISFSGLPAGVTSNTNGQLVIPAGTPAGTHTITYKVCEKLNPTNCQTVTSTLVIGTGSLTVTPVTPLTVPNGISGGTTSSVLTGITLNGATVTNTNSVTISFSGLPTGVTSNTNGQLVIPAGTPAGTHTITYRVCEKLNPTNCQTVTSTLVIGTGSLTVTPTNLTHPNGTQGGTTTGTVLTGVKINGNPVNTASVTITWNSLPPNATGNASGTVTIAPNTPAGTYTISYTVCERLNGNSNCQSVTSQITIGGGSLTATPTNLTHPNGTQGGTTTGTVLTGVKINGNPVNTASVTITWNSLPPGFTGTNSGTVTVPANTPAGIYTVTYTVCERLNSNSNCKTVSSTITVGNGSMIVVPTPMTVPNGTIGGTSTPSVLTGVVLNGNSNPAPNTVSITWNTLPPRATGNNDGTVNVAPNTPAGTYTVSYTICEALNSGHCTTVTSTITIGGGVLTVTPVTTLTVANGAQGGTTTSSVLTGVSLNGQPANSQSVTITFSGLPAGVTSNTNGQLVVAPGTPATNTTIYYTVCETLNANNNCHTYSTTLVIGTPNLSVTPRTYAIPDATVGGTTSSVLETVTIDGHTPSSQSVTITFGNLPVGIQTTTSGGFRVPAGTPTGIHTVTYTVCEVLNPDHCVTSIATIAVGNVPVVTPNAFTYTGTATVTTPSILDDDTVGTQSATTGTGGNVVINITSTPTGTVVPSLDANNGRVTIPAGTPPGIYTITYDVCTTATPTACTPGVVVITIPNVPVITPDDMVYTDTTTTTAGNILTNDRVGTQSATAGNGGNVSITVTIPATPKAPGATVPTLNPNTGVVTVPAGTPSGTYTITYKICTTATPTSCDTGVVTITVSGTVTEAPDTNDITAYTRINTPVTVGVTSSTTVTVSIPSQPANGTAVSNGDGTITYTPNNGFKGTDSFEYSLCNAAGCRTATISVRVTSELIIYNGVSIGGSDKNNHFHIEGIENYPNNTVRIYNRWGVKVFEMSGYNNTTKAFKGVSDARATLEASDNLPQGTYYYIIEYVDEHNKTQTETGWLYLKKN